MEVLSVDMTDECKIEMHHETPESSSNQGTPSPSTLVRVSPSGSSKRKSRPVKRVVDESEEPQVELLTSMQMTSDGVATSGSPDRPPDVSTFDSDDMNDRNKHDDQNPFHNMDQAEVLRRISEMLSNTTSQCSSSPNHMSMLLNSVAGGSCSMDSSVASSPLFNPVDNKVPDTIFQALLNANLANMVGSTATTPVCKPLSLATLIPNSGADSVVTQTPVSTPFPLTLSKGPVKRKLFDGSRELIRQAASTITNDERIDLDDLENFAQVFKKQRIKFGFTQGDVGIALGRRYGTDFSQTTISRFEALNLSFKNMCKLRPLLKEWLADAEQAIANGASLNDLLDKPTPKATTAETPDAGETVLPTPMLGNGGEPHVKRRRKRTNLDLSQRTTLDAYFTVNPRPDHDRMTEIAQALELDRDVVRVWFCNRRQKMRRSDEPESGDNILLNSLKALAQTQNEESSPSGST